jgi:hypothetical protein
VTVFSRPATEPVKVAVLKRCGSKGAKMQTDSFVASGSSPTPDFELQNHGSIFLLIPQSTSARIWIDDHIGKGNGYQPHYPTVVIEHRYIADIVEGIVADGLVLA